MTSRRGRSKEYGVRSKENKEEDRRMEGEEKRVDLLGQLFYFVAQM